VSVVITGLMMALFTGHEASEFQVRVNLNYYLADNAAMIIALLWEQRPEPEARCGRDYTDEIRN